MSKKVITILLMSTLVLSLACGCKNNDTESTSSTDSKTESSVSSSTESSKQNESKTESSKQSESKAESSKQDNSNSDSSNSDSSIVTARTEKDFNEFMKKMDVITPQYTFEDVLDVILDEINTFGEPDSQLSGPLKQWYVFQGCTVEIEYVQGGLVVYVTYTTNKEATTKFYPTKPSNSYDKNSNYRDEIQKLIDKVQPITTSSTREEVIDILGEPDESIESKEIRYDKYNFEDDKIEVTYYDGGLILNIWDSEKYEMIAVVYTK